MFKLRSLPLGLLLLFAGVNSHAQESRKVMVPVFELPAVQGRWDRLTNAVSSGRVYDFAISMDTYETNDYTKESRVVFANPGGFDALECWVGLAQQQHTGETRFMILGDGTLLYRSPWMNWRDKAEKVHVSIKGYKGISLVAEGHLMNKFDMAIWGEPLLVQTSPPQLQDAPTLAPVNPPASGETSDRLARLMTVHQFGNGSIDIFINGTKVEFGKAKPLNEDGRLMVPMRPIFEALGARVVYKPLSHQIVATRDAQIISMVMGTKTANINGRQTNLDVPTRIFAGETMVPLRFVAESLGVPVEYK